MDEVMAVEHVDSVPRSVVGFDRHDLIGCKPDNVLQAQALVGVDDSVVVVGSRENAEVDQVDMNRVAPATTTVLELPDLDSPTGHVCQETVLDIRKDNAVDLPLSVATIKLEASINTRGLVGREIDLAQAVGDDACVSHRGRADNELHDLVGVEIVGIRSNIIRVPQRDVLASKGSKVEYNLVAFGHADVDLGSGDGPNKEPSVACNDLERDLCTRPSRPAEVEEEGPGDGGVEEAEAILARLNVKEWPRLSVDVDDIAKEGISLSSRTEESSVILVLFGAENQRNIVNSVSRRQAETVLLGVVDDVSSSLA